MRKRRPAAETPGYTEGQFHPLEAAAAVPLTVACVLRSGPLYDARWVRALAAQVARHLPESHRFVCLTDCEVRSAAGVEVIPLRHGWPGWWSKIELFRPGLFDGPVLYLDLDTLIVGDLGDLAAYRGRFAILRDWNRPGGFGSGVMAWTPGPHSEAIYELFAAAPEKAMAGFRGDQNWIEAALGTGPEVDRLQDLFPGQVASYKVDRCISRAPDGTRLIAFHGNPKPSDCGGWAQAHWEAAVRGD